MSNGFYKKKSYSPANNKPYGRNGNIPNNSGPMPNANELREKLGTDRINYEDCSIDLCPRCAAGPLPVKLSKEGHAYWACKECNGVFSSKYPDTFEENCRKYESERENAPQTNQTRGAPKGSGNSGGNNNGRVNTGNQRASVIKVADYNHGNKVSPSSSNTKEMMLLTLQNIERQIRIHNSNTFMLLTQIAKNLDMRNIPDLLRSDEVMDAIHEDAENDMSNGQEELC